MFHQVFKTTDILFWHKFRRSGEIVCYAGEGRDPKHYKRILVEQTYFVKHYINILVKLAFDSVIPNDKLDKTVKLAVESQNRKL